MSNMKIGIVGAGKIGGMLTRRLTKLGHRVAVANSHGPESLKNLAQETGATPVDVREAIRGKDIVIIAIPEKNIRDLPKDLFRDVSPTTVVVDTGNYYPKQRDGRIDEIEQGLPESRWVERQIGHSVVKAFNNMYAQHQMDLGKPKRDPNRIALPVAGDDPGAKAKVMQLLDDLGFDAVDGGSLDESWRQQPGTPVYTADLDAAGTRRVLREATRERSPEWRA